MHRLGNVYQETLTEFHAVTNAKMKKEYFKDNRKITRIREF